MTVERKEGAIFDEYQIYVLKMLDDMFPTIKLRASSGHRTALNQLHVIGTYAAKFAYPEFDINDVTTQIEVEVNGIKQKKHKWYRTWGMCLNKGIIVNPPIGDIVPFDYISNGVNKKGKFIDASNHIKPLDIDATKETCPIDMSALIDGVSDIERVNQCMKLAMDSGVPIKSIVVEHGNGCVHLNLKLKAA
jgi:hypothetical protein